MEMQKYLRSYLLVALSVIACSCGSDKSEQRGGRQRNNIFETGTLEAINNKSFTMPRYRNWNTMRVIGLLENGTMVQPGDSVIQLDPTNVNSYILDRETSYETQLANMEKLLVDQSNSISQLESSIKSQTAAYNLKKIEVEASMFETERFRRIKALEFQQADINLAKEKRRLELARDMNENDLKIQKIRVRQVENELEAAKKILPELTIRTPVAGVFQVGYNWRTGTTIVIGDEIYGGNNMANVPELKNMKVTTFINENDFLKIREGQKVAVRLDAMPSIVFDGEVSYVGKFCRLKEPNTSNRQKVFDVEVRVLKPDERLKPGMTVSCEYLID